MSTTVSQMRPAFKDASQFEIKGRGIVFATVLDRETHDFSHLLQKEVIINDKLWFCTGIERHCTCPPWRVGARIGIVVREVKPENHHSIHAAVASLTR